MSRFWKLAFAIALVAPAGSRAQASFDPSLTGMTSTATTTTFTYSLAFTTSASQGTAQLATGNYLTLYDLYANASTLVGFSTSGGIGISQALLGVTPTGFNPPPTDDPTLYNLVFTYTGPTLSANTSFTVSFTLNGPFTTHSGLYTSNTQYTANTGGVGSTATEAFATTPFAASTAVPEPGSFALVGIAGVIGLAFRAGKKAALRA